MDGLADAARSLVSAIRRSLTGCEKRPGNGDHARQTGVWVGLTLGATPRRFISSHFTGQTGY